ncbi:MAG: Phage capsid family protein, partial [Akkermansiaceae bacterium]|nr:Phage capsid family protein [Akkermansiaceae bacterium]
KFYASSRGAGRMRGTGIVANDAQRIATWDNGVMYCEGKEVKITNCIPNNIATNKTAILYGDPSSVYVGMWGGLELATDLATKAATGGKVIRVFQDVDFQIPQPAHWSAIQDLTP